MELAMYLLFKLLHVIAVVAFLGNITTGLFWHAHVARSGDPKLLANVMRGIIRSDRAFTIPGVIGIVASGVAMAMLGGYPILRTGWILWTLVLFAISGLAFAVLVAPMQKRLLALAEHAATPATFDHAGYRALALRWEIWGAVALATPFAGLALMVLKPAF
jgi:uncharacterized membrane protein